MAAPPQCHGQPDIITLSCGATSRHHNRPPIWIFPLPNGMEGRRHLEDPEPGPVTGSSPSPPTSSSYQAGVDVHRDDELGYLSLSDSGVRRRDAMVFDSALRHGLPIAAVPGGGYRRETGGS